MIDTGTHPATMDLEDRLPIRRLMGLAVFGEMLAARIYGLMAQLRPEHSPVLRKFASMEGQHATWFREARRCNAIEPDKEFADHELDYLIAQVNDHHAAGDGEALAFVQESIVESMSNAIYEPYLQVADRYPGTRDVFARALDEERYHVEWMTRYLRLRFFDAEGGFVR